jgi:hypothetical protein
MAFAPAGGVAKKRKRSAISYQPSSRPAQAIEMAFPGLALW